MKSKFIFLVLGLLIASGPSTAGILFDPYIGKVDTEITTKIEAFPSLNSEDTVNSNSVYGARLGYSFSMLSLGIDYQVLSGEDRYDKDFSINNTSLFLGVELPLWIRFWGEYFLSSETSGDTSETVDDLKMVNGYGFGVGFTGLPFVSINLEIENVNYEYVISGLDVEYSQKNTILTLSIPLEF
jgi:hypothetical protein